MHFQWHYYAWVFACFGFERFILKKECLVLVFFTSEFLLCKGFEHEQNRADRDNYVVVNFTNIQSGKDWLKNFKINFVILVKNQNSFLFVLGAEDQFKKKLQYYDYQNESYDLGSVMHYSSYSFSSNGFPTILTRKGALIAENYNFSLLSNTDVTSIRKAYGCKLKILKFIFLH